MTAVRRGVTAVLSVAVLTIGLAGCGHAEGTSKPLHAAANFDPSLPGFVACSRIIVEGDVVRVTDGSPGRMVTTLQVTDWVKPSTGRTRAKIDTVDVARDGVYKRWAPGTHLFLAVDVDPSVLPNWEFTGDAAAAIRNAVSPAKKLTCPYGPS